MEANSTLYTCIQKGKNMANIEEKVENLVKPTIEGLGYRLYDVEYTKEGKDYFLRIYIENEKGISITDCEKVTGAINDMLDESDYIKNEYFLEVSSSGIEKVLRKEIHLQENLGKEVEIRLFKPIEKEKILNGILIGFDKESIYIEINSEKKSIERKQIAQIKTKYNWEGKD